MNTPRKRILGLAEKYKKLSIVTQKLTSNIANMGMTRFTYYHQKLEDFLQLVLDDKDLEIAEIITQEVPEEVPEDVPEDVIEEVPEDVIEDVPEDVTEDLPEDVRSTGLFSLPTISEPSSNEDLLHIATFAP
jgi:hypothetical protein